MPRRTDGLYQRRGHFYFKWKSIDGVWHEHATRTRNYAEARSIRSRDYKSLPNKKSDIPDALSRDEAHRLLQLARACGEDAVAPFAAVLAYATGMRSREIKQLRLGAIHLDSAHPQIQVKRMTTKSNKGARFVALDSMACWALRKLLSRATTLGSTAPEHYLLPTLLDRHTRANDPLHGGSGWDAMHPQSSWEAEWNQIRKQARIQRRFHDLRHSYITRAAEAGVPLLVIQQQVGHMSKEMIDHYTHISQAAVHKAAELMERQNPDLPVHLGLRSLCGEGAEEGSNNGTEPKQERVGGKHKRAGVQ
jgi:integrase